jgi:GT2 family glycosyltransferase
MPNEMASGGGVVIAVLNWNGYALTRACLESLDCLRGPAHSVLVVDNASREREGERLADEFGGRVEALTLPRNLGVGGGYNAAIGWAAERGASHVLLLNNDTVIADPEFAERLVEACGPGVFAVGPLVREPSGRVWSSGGWYNWRDYLSGHTRADGIVSKSTPYEVAWIDGSCMLVSVDAALAIGGFDETFFLYWEETDVCARAWEHGLRCLVQPRTSVVHLVNGTVRPSQGDYYKLRNAIFYVRRHGTSRQNAAYLARLLGWRMPLFAARRIKHGGGVAATARMVLGALAWNVRDAVRGRGWTRPAVGSLADKPAGPGRAAR